MTLPFSRQTLDALMDEAGIDLLLVTSKENVQYLLGGYRSSFYGHRDAIGVSRYLPCLGYPKGEPEKAFYIGNPLERSQQELEPNFWVENVSSDCWHSETTGREAAAFILKMGLGKGTVGVETSFLPADCFAVLEQELPSVKFVNAHYTLDRLRAVKRPDELTLVREASELIVASMFQAVQTTIGAIEKQIMAQHRSSEASRRLESIPGIGVTGAAAITATVPDPKVFRSGRDFAAWIGLVPRQDSTGGKQKLGPISKQGDRYLRRILVVGAHAVLRYAKQNPEKYPWLTQLLARRPFKVVAVALANKMARTAWALLAHGGTYRAPVLAEAA